MKHYVLGAFFFAAIALRDFMHAGLSELTLVFCLLGYINLKSAAFEPIKMTFLSLSLILMIAFGSSVFNSLPESSLLYFTHLAFSIILVLLFVLCDNINKMLLVFVQLSTFVSLASFFFLIYFYISGGAFSEFLYTRGEYARAQGFLEGPNYYSISALFSLFVSIYLVRVYRKSGFYIFCNVLGAFSTLSRGAFLAIASVIFVFFLLDGSFRRRTLMYLVSFTGTVSVAAVAWANLESASFSSVLRVLESRFSDGGGGIQARVESIIGVLTNIGSYNLLFGSGRFDYNAVGLTHPPHNLFVTMISDYGAFSVFLLFSLFGVVTYYCKFISPNERIVVLSIMIAVLLVGLTNDYQFVREWWLSLALSIYILKVGLIKANFQQRTRVPCKQ